MPSRPEFGGAASRAAIGPSMIVTSLSSASSHISAAHRSRSADRLSLPQAASTSSDTAATHGNQRPG